MTQPRRHFLQTGLTALAIATGLQTGCLQTRPGNSPQAGEGVPELALPDERGRTVSLHETIASHDAVVLIFYRGHW